MSNALDQLWITGFIRPILQPESSKNPDHVAVDETVIQLGDEKYWLYAAGDIDTNELRYTTTERTTNTVLAQTFLSELSKKYDGNDAVFLIDGSRSLQAAYYQASTNFRRETWKSEWL